MSSKLSDERIRSINELGKRFSDATIFMHEAIAKKAGLSGTDHKYLGLIIENGPISAGELSKLTGLTTGAITGLVDRLEKKKLVKRKFDKSDRRKIVIEPNRDNAKKLLGGIFSDLQNKIVHLITSLSAEEIKIIEKYLLSAIQIMKDLTHDLQNTGNTLQKNSKPHK